MRLAVFLLLASICVAADARAQSSADLVVVITGTKQFHQPSCPLVVQAGTHVRVMKRSEATRRGLTAHDCGSISGPIVSGDPNQVKVYSQPNDNKYHTATCPKLGKTRTTLTLDEAGKKLWPCPVCHPPIRKRTVS